jgi:hypothetical protein
MAGWFGGRTDNLLMRFTDVMYAFPDLLFIILLTVVFKQTPFGQAMDGLLLVFVAIGLTTWVTVGRLVRGQMLALKETEFVEAARAIGVSDRKIVTKHLLPNGIGPIIVAITLGIPAAILAEAPEHDAITLCANSDGKPWTVSGFRASWRKVRVKLEHQGKVGPALTLYGLRHTVAVILREIGMDERTIADALGQIQATRHLLAADRFKGAAAPHAGVGDGPGQLDGLARAPEAARGNGLRLGGVPRHPPGQRPGRGSLSWACHRSLARHRPLTWPWQ